MTFFVSIVLPRLLEEFQEHRYLCVRRSFFFFMLKAFYLPCPCCIYFLSCFFCPHLSSTTPSPPPFFFAPFAVKRQGYTRPKEYVVTEWPIKADVVPDFWSLVYDHDCPAVVVLCNPEKSLVNGKVVCLGEKRGSCYNNIRL